MGDSLTDLKHKDQFDKTHTIQPETKRLLVAFTKEDGKKLHEFLISQTDDFLPRNHAQVAIDASEVPSFVMSLFMRPKFEKYPYPPGLIEEETQAQKLNFKESHLTCYHLNKQKITDIVYLQDKQSIEARLRAR